MKAVLVFPAAFVLAACSDVCRNTPHQTVNSPDGARKAVLFDRNCGATVGATTQVSLALPNDEPTAKGNVFIADRGSGSTAWGGPWAEVQWIGPRELVVRYDVTARVFTKKVAVGDVSITFQPKRR